MASFREDGKAIDVYVSYDADKDDPVFAEGFHGMAMEDAASGDKVAIEIAQRVHEIVVGSGVTAAKGDILYINDDQTITDTTGDRPFMIVTVEKDANDVVWGLLLPQKSE